MAPVLLNPARFGGGGGGGGGGSYATEVLADTPLAYWRLGEPSGTTAADASGNGRNATYINGPTLGAPGLLSTSSDTAMGMAANTGQSAFIANAAWMNVSALTVECLVKLTSATDGVSGDGIVSRFNGLASNWLIWRDTSGRLAAQVRNTANTVHSVSASSVATLGAIYHVALTVAGTSMILYVNGTAFPTTFAGTLGSCTQQIELGLYQGAASTGPGGTLDEVAIYGSALSATRIAAHYAAA